MTEEYGEESSPDMEDLKQYDDADTSLKVPVRIEQIDVPVMVHPLPARNGSARSVGVPSGAPAQQIVGRDLRRTKLTVWATADASAFLEIGTNRDEVDGGSGALLPALADDLSDGAPVMIVMTHCEAVYVRNSTGAGATFSYVAEYWGD